jgi:hypothetical protein
VTVSATHLTTAGSATDATSYNTASISPGADRLILAWVFNNRGIAGVNTPTLSGNGLTWVSVISESFGGFDAARLTLYRAMGAAPSAGAVTIDCGGQTQAHCLWSIVEFDGADTSGTNGSGALVQAVYDDASSAASLSVTLAAFADAANATAGGMGLNGSVADVVPGSGFTELAESALIETFKMQSQWRDDNDTTVDWSWTGSVSVLGIAVEISAAPSTFADGWSVGAVPLGF